MDFEALAMILPKKPQAWTVPDIKVWLQFIGLQSLQPQFEQCVIDGSCLEQLTEADFRSQLHIESRIILKKLMNWITHGIKQYEDFLLHNAPLKMMNSQMQPEITQKMSFQTQQFQQEKVVYEKMEIEEPLKRQQLTYNENDKKIEEDELIIRQCQGSQNAYYSLKQKGGVMGRHSTNAILVLDEYVSRFHAEVIYEEGEYYLCDRGSSSGTFLKITEKLRIQSGMIIELGSNQFELEIEKNNYIVMRTIEGPNVCQIFPLPKKQKVTIGRKGTNDISFPDDQHMSNIHATIFEVDSEWYLQDMATTNGTWQRLSPEGVESGRFLLEDQSQFKLSTNLTYECRRNRGNRKTFKEKTEKCSYCEVADRNAIYLPCKHNTGCYGCVSKLKAQKCAICESYIQDIIKIFTV